MKYIYLSHATLFILGLWLGYKNQVPLPATSLAIPSPSVKLGDNSSKICLLPAPNPATNNALSHVKITELPNESNITEQPAEIMVRKNAVKNFERSQDKLTHARLQLGNKLIEQALDIDPYNFEEMTEILRSIHTINNDEGDIELDDAIISKAINAAKERTDLSGYDRAKLLTTLKGNITQKDYDSLIEIALSTHSDEGILQRVIMDLIDYSSTDNQETKENALKKLQNYDDFQEY
ncbi:hypothetical protein CXF85_22510 [Colwellia sp. 75C3]|uniref:hypothetical protein n=1 Tax=Colwellia sp. 75C3 TaxID=888425 RepID=UPI000C331B15|nr:hypothetical protein [Colwellia sp. 75C3]PKG80878.1 hypothetical protein CXF85_22510 [Colwellia sp. 75C3]